MLMLTVLGEVGGDSGGDIIVAIATTVWLAGDGSSGLAAFAATSWLTAFAAARGLG
jgi:hypothetical protein